MHGLTLRYSLLRKSHLFCKPFQLNEMSIYKVRSEVNSVKNDSPTCIDPVQDYKNCTGAPAVLKGCPFKRHMA